MNNIFENARYCQIFIKALQPCKIVSYSSFLKVKKLQDQIRFFLYCKIQQKNKNVLLFFKRISVIEIDQLGIGLLTLNSVELITFEGVDL